MRVLHLVRDLISHSPFTCFHFSTQTQNTVSKGFRETVQDLSNNPTPEEIAKAVGKSLNSFAFVDTFDGVDRPLVIFEATVGFDVGVSAAIVKVGVRGAITFTVEIDFFDPYPETSGGLIRPYELIAYSCNPVDWFELTLSIKLSLSIYVSVGE
eukprot:14700484-Ditylum_brightwellii.AAC.1